MTPHREWLCEYEKYNGGNFFLRDESMDRIIGCGRVKLLLKDGSIRTIPGVLHILELAIKLISIRKKVMYVYKLFLQKKHVKWFEGQWSR